MLLEKLCQRLSIKVKYDRFFGQGGYCRLRDKKYFIINDRLSNETKEEIFLRELKTMQVNPQDVPEKLKNLLNSQ
jgi:hypothetical protein